MSKLKIVDSITADECELARSLVDFFPPAVFDIHVHLFNREHFIPDTLIPLLRESTVLGLADYQKALGRWLPGRTVECLAFGFPIRGNNRPEINRWISTQVRREQTNNRGIALASPEDKPADVLDQIRQGGLVGIKPYHVYAPLPDTSQLTIEQFTPEWMWEICHDIRGVLMLHIKRHRSLADPENQKALRRLARKYPNCRVVLAHIGCSFSYRHARRGLHTLLDLDNVCVDTSAVTEMEAMSRAIEILGPRRVLFGSDFPVSEFRGRCVALYDSFLWLDGNSDLRKKAYPPTDGTLIGLESLLCLREAAEDAGLTSADLQDIFHDNAVRLLAPHLPPAAVPSSPSGPELWSQARQRISCGTGLLSKRAAMMDPVSWPSYFSRCSGSNVWGIDGRRFVDFTGGVGAVLLGYGDPDVNRAVKRRLDAGSHSSLCSSDELELAELLLALHPWAQRVRFARGGGEALSAAVRIARAATGRSGIAFCGYHGWHDWYLAANLADDSSLDGHLLPGLPPLGVPRELKGTSFPFRYNDLASFDQALARLEGKFAGVVMEPMRSQHPKDGFLEKVADRCRRAGGVLVIDEVTSGWRFGFPGAMAALGLNPDLAVYAKAISNGVPCAAIVGRGDIMDAADPSFISSTYWTDGLGPAAALACVRKMRATNTQKYVSRLGASLQNSLCDLGKKHPDARFTVGGQPAAPSLSFDLGPDSAAAKQILTRRMVERGFLVMGQLYLMASHTESEIEALVDSLSPAVAEIEQLSGKKQLQREAGAEGGLNHAMGGFARLA